MKVLCVGGGSVAGGGEGAGGACAARVYGAGTPGPKVKLFQSDKAMDFFRWKPRKSVILASYPPLSRV
jgi:hypothetical protein